VGSLRKGAGEMSDKDKRSPGSRTILQHYFITAVVVLITMIAILFVMFGGGTGKVALNTLLGSPYLIELVILAICIVLYLRWRPRFRREAEDAPRTSRGQDPVRGGVSIGEKKGVGQG
jgi:hypothetical protein